jgi:hypothetical protein
MTSTGVAFTMSTEQGEINREKLVSDIIHYLITEYEINRDQISKYTNASNSVTVYVTGAPPDFPGFGHSSVPVCEMSDELKYGYVPRSQYGREVLQIWTTEQTAPEWE